MSIKIKALPANDGDCFIITFGEGKKIYNILVDGGSTTRNSLRKLKLELQSIKELNQCIDLLIVTHIDKDHIEGILKIFELDIYKSLIKKVWFNSGRNIANFFNTIQTSERDIPILLGNDIKIGIEQGNSLEKELIKQNLVTEEVIIQGKKFNLDEATLHILSPSINNLKSLNEIWEVELEEGNSDLQVSVSEKLNDYNETIKVLSDRKFFEDRSKVNASSITFLLEYKDKKILMLGDAPPSIIIEGLMKLNYNSQKKIYIDLMKVSHHGSRKNTSTDLLDLIDCSRYLISTNGGKVKRLLPDKECLSRIISNNEERKVEFYFNYPVFGNIFSDEEIEVYGIDCYDISIEPIDYIVEV
ncbi:MBL fold metallo-hydrolase [Bacillus sp. Cs-700]|uniref:ComEC/Rec2 family competence protein n=1 Tax=Bacillus sp. Cs-700 TaxID=2589818 RepID=UPI001407D9B8|nr:MBL fold metallo-hydrolase [Bacillus sp. Cs-700]